MTLAFVLVNCALDQSAAVEKAAKEIKGVLQAYSTTGIYDLILLVEAADEIVLQEVIKSVRGINGVTSTIEAIVYKADTSASSATAE